MNVPRLKPASLDGAVRADPKPAPAIVHKLPPRRNYAEAAIKHATAIAGVTGGRKIANHELRGNWHTRGPEDIVRLTGIETRRWVAPGDDV